MLLVNIQGSLHCKQGMLLVNIQGSLHCKQGMLLVNIQGNLHGETKAVYRKHHILQPSVVNLQHPVSKYIS